MSFFYEKKKGGSKSKKAVQTIPVHLMHERECGLCYLDKREKELDTPKFEPSGPKDADVYILGAHPSEKEDQNGKHFSGDTSTLLRNYVPARYKRKVRYNFTSRCHPLSSNDKELLTQIECCRPSVIRDIEATKPKIIVGVGNPVLKWALGKGGMMDAWRGRTIPIKIGSHLCWYMPVYDPTFVYLEGKKNKRGERQDSKYDSFFLRDLRTACDGVDNGDFDTVPWIEESDIDSDCAWIKGHSEMDFRKLERFLKKAQEKEYVGLDLETTAFRPYSNGRILSCSVTTEDGTLAFPLQHKKGWRSWDRKYEQKALDLFGEFIVNSKAKIWHNMGFDMEWLHHFYGIDVFKNQRYEDTLIMAYLIDSRKGMLSLDTLARVRLGVWLKDQSNVDRANLESEPYEKLLRYNALDTKIMFELFFLLKKDLEDAKTLEPNYEEMLRSAAMLVLCQARGIVPNGERMDKFHDEFTTTINAIEEYLNNLVVIKKFKRAKKHPFQPSSSHDVKYLLDEMLDLPQGRQYKDKSKKTWSYTTDEGCLSAIKREVGGEAGEIAEKLLQHRSASKMLSTYIEGIHAVTHSDGLLHTNYSQTFTSTGRLNSSDPNCFPPGVEYLTEKGWVDCSELDRETKVAQVDLTSDNLSMDFAMPINYIEHDFDGDLYHLKSGKVDIPCTADHRFHIKSTAEAPFRTVTAESYPTYGTWQPCAGEFVGGDVDLLDDQVRLGVAFNADAYWPDEKHVVWEFSKQRKIDRCRQLLTNLGIPHNENKGKTTTTFYVAARHVPGWLKSWRRFSWDLLKLNRRCLDVLIEELYHWDGCVDGLQYSSQYRGDADIIQALQVLSSRRTQMREGLSTAENNHYYLDSCDRNGIHMTHTLEKDRVAHKGKVYCLTMPNDTLVVRHNGKVLITGQSQNFPKRKMKIIREIIGAPHGYHIVSADYGQIEARVFAMASKDKAFMDALWTGYDVHQAWALKIINAYNDMFDIIAAKYELRRDDFDSFSAYEKKVVKSLRGDTKNGWVFPQFFGSSPYSCAANMQIPPEIAEKLAKEFWETFTGVKRWQEKTVKFYEKNGYVETLTGKRRYGPLSYNEIINTPIQGTAATIVLNAMNELSELSRKDENLIHLQPNLNIHDDITLYLPDKTIEKDIEIIAKTMVTPRFDFINVPLVAEVEIGPDWGNQYVYGEYSSNEGWAA